MQTAIMTIFQFTPEEVVEIRVGVGGEEVMSRSGRISGVEVVFVVRCNVVVIFRVVLCLQCDCDLEYQEKRMSLTINIGRISSD